MSAIDNVTLQDLWSYISNKIACKHNDPFEELNGIIIPIKADGTFSDPLYSDEFDNVYEWIADLCRNTDKFDTPSFGFMIPGWKKDPETMERIGKNIMFVLVRDHENMEIGTWDLDTNEINMFPEQYDSDSHGDGPMPMALGALSVGISIEQGGLGEPGRLMREARDLMRRGEEMAARAIALLNGMSNN